MAYKETDHQEFHPRREHELLSYATQRMTPAEEHDFLKNFRHLSFQDRFELLYTIADEQAERRLEERVIHLN